MIKALLRLGDGLSSGRPWLRSVVKKIQLGLIQAGFPLEADGMFGRGTLNAIKAFQSSVGLEESGIFDPGSWTKLAPHLEAATGEREARIREMLVRFRGDLDWVHERESHSGRPYWPGGVSGATLDPGVDLGHASSETIEELYSPLLTQAQMKALRLVYGIKGEDARTALHALPDLAAIRISREQAAELMPYAAKPYWDGICRRFPALARKDTLPTVQTVLLSLAYNRGVFNRYLEPLRDLLTAKSWNEAADRIASMQQSHQLHGIRIRRRQEAMLIRAELEFDVSS
ncbi:MAG: pesticin C-terminus-like muramidase [Thermoanaerobaculia bacterium]